MKCMSCDSEVNSQWKHAIETNICPFCGKTIMDENLKNYLCSLRDNLEILQEYQDQLNDWMLSNFNYIKTDSPNLINYVPKDSLKFIKKDKIVKDKESDEEDITKNEEKANEFFKRAEAVKSSDGFSSVKEKTEHLKKLAQHIKNIGGSSTYSPIDNEMMNVEDPEAVQDLKDMLNNGQAICSSLDTSDNEDDIPAAVLAMANNAKNKNSTSNASDLIKLQNMYDKVKISQNNFNLSKGSFSRSS